MSHDDVERRKLLTRAFGRVKRSNDGVNVACYCPRCAERGKRKLKLAVRLDDGRYHCWTCGVKGRSISTLIEDVRPELRVDAHRLFPRALSQRPDVVVPERECIRLPEDFLLLAPNVTAQLPEVRRAVSYCSSRGLMIDKMWRFRLGTTTSGKFAGNLIVPSFDALGELNYYVVRSTRPDAYIRYMNAPGRKQSIVFNELDVDWNRELVVTEGPFDTFNCDANVVCALGNNLDEGFLLFHRIVEHGTPVVLAFDKGESRSTARVARKLYGYDIDVRVASLGGAKDLGEMTRAEVRECIAGAKHWTPDGELMYRISSIDAFGWAPLSGSR